MILLKLRCENKCFELAEKFEAQYKNASIGHRRILMALWETGSLRYVIIYKGKLVAALAVKKRWSRYHVLQLGSIFKGCGTRLYNCVKSLPLEVVTTNGSRGFWIKMGLIQKVGPYFNVFINERAAS